MIDDLSFLAIVLYICHINRKLHSATIIRRCIPFFVKTKGFSAGIKSQRYDLDKFNFRCYRHGKLHLGHQLSRTNTEIAFGFVTSIFEHIEIDFDHFCSQHDFFFKKIHQKINFLKNLYIQALKKTGSRPSDSSIVAGSDDQTPGIYRAIFCII